MEGLLGSEFALVLRDSLNSTPRRRSLTSPMPPAMPSPQKKPRALPFSIRCNMQLEPRANFPPFPTSPTSPLPPPSVCLPSIVTSPITPTPPISTSAPRSSSPTTSPRLSVHHRPICKPTRPSAPTLSAPLRVPLPPCAPLSPPSSPPHSPLPLPTRPLDVLAAVSLQHRLQPMHPSLTSPPSAPPAPPAPPPSQPRAEHLPSTSTVAGASSRLLPVLPTSPVNSEVRRPPSPRPRPASRKKSSACKGSKPARPKVFACSQCPSTFSQQFNLNKHVRAVHERRRPFECSVCHARFQQKSHRTMHHLAVHEKLRQFSCDQCNASFSWRGVLKKHRKSIHGITE